MRRIRLSNGVDWDPENGVGFYDVQTNPYNADYFTKYEKYARSDFGIKLNRKRLDLVSGYIRDSVVVDIGIGSGQFLQSRAGTTYGYDVSLFAVNFLLSVNRWWDPWLQDPPNVTMWDSMEHMRRPELLLATVKDFVFVSLPIFSGPDHVLQSKHFRPDEHYWYFTWGGLIKFMARHGFKIVERNTMETKLGREDIDTFVFRRNRR